MMRLFRATLAARGRNSALLSAGLSAAFFTISCGGDDSGESTNPATCTPGQLNCACANNACAAGLACQAGMCVNPNAAPGTGGTAAPGTGGTVAPTGGTAAPTGGAAAGTAAPTGGMGASGGTMAVTGGNGGSGGEPPATGGMGATGGTGGGASGDIPWGNTCTAPQQNETVGNPCPGTPPPAITLTEIASGLSSPTHLAQAPGDPTRLYVLEQIGTVRVIENGELLPQPAADLRDLSGAPFAADTIFGGYVEGGLLSMVFDPEFETTGRLWISFTTQGPGFVVGQFALDESDPNAIDVTRFQELVSFPQYPFAPGIAATNHVGSMLAFGPDGCMYISRGDGGGENDQQMSGQDLSDDLCSILRIDVDNYPAAAPGNLQGHIWNFGFRNPWRFSFDRATGDMYIGDVGQDPGTGFEEIEVEPRGVAGRNYGWSVAQGSSVCNGDCSGMTLPALEYGITSSRNSVIGGYVYRGSAIPDMVGRYIWADWTERQIKTFVYQGESDGQPQICDEYDTGVTVPLKVRSFAEGIDGEIYVVAGANPAQSLGGAGLNEPGAVYRIDPQ